MSDAGDQAPIAPWAHAVPSSRNPKRLLPQTIGHRGFKAACPENTMLSFRRAVEAGAQAIETDLHLSADGVVVLSHDASAKRCFGLDRRVSACDWDLLSTLRTLREPHEPMPRLADLLEWMAKPENHEIWVILDIKNDDAAEKLVPAIKQVIKTAPSPVPWDQRIVLACLNTNFVHNCRRQLPSYTVVFTGGFLPYAHYFFTLPAVGFNILQKALIGPPGWVFLRALRQTQRPLFVWTVNEERWMRWCIAKNLRRRRQAGPRLRVIDGVITDDPKLFREVCEQWEDEEDGLCEKEAIRGPGRVERLASATVWMVAAQLFCTYRMAVRLVSWQCGWRSEI